MSPAVNAALSSWSLDPWLGAPLLLVSILYVRGFARLRLRHPEHFPNWRRVAFLCGIASFVFAVASPLDAFADLLLQVHMAQHLLLMMIAPPLLWMGAPVAPLFEALPRGFLKDGLGPLLAWPALQRGLRFLVHPVTAWLAFVATTWLWHAPALYELALRSRFWHDVEHLCFFGAALLFWFPVIQPWPSRPVWSRLAMLPYLVLAGLQNTAFCALFAFSGRLFYPSYAEMPRLWGISALGDQAAAGAVMWVPASIVLVVAVVWTTLSALEPKGLRAQPLPRTSAARRVPLDLLNVHGVSSLALRRTLQAGMFALAAAIVIDGFWGPEQSFLNLAGVLPWTHWRGLLVVGLLVFGNWFCFACPFTLPRALARRVLGGARTPPAWLRTKWLAAALFLAFFVAYEAFDLWDSPYLTAWIVVGYFGGAFVIDGVYGKASFCRAVCPIGQFQFLSATLSPFEVRARDRDVCASCTTHECLKGSASAPGCDLDLFQPAKVGNLDCTFCLDCVRACPHDNVGLQPHWPARELVSDVARAGVGRLSRRPDLAFVALLFSFGAFANAAGMIAPVAGWLQALALRTGTSEPVAAAAFGVLSMGVLPACAVWSVGRVGHALSGLRLGASLRAALTHRFVFSLVPLGFAMWLAHFFFHWVTAAGALPVVLGRFVANHASASHEMSAGLVSADWIPLELAALAVGLWATLLVAWKIAQSATATDRAAVRLFAPWGGLAILLWGLGVWILLQPMQMRGIPMSLGLAVSIEVGTG